MIKTIAFVLGLLLSVPAYGISMWTPDDNEGGVHDYTQPSAELEAPQLIPDCAAGSGVVIVTPENAGSVDFSDAATPVYCFTPGDYTAVVTGDFNARSKIVNLTSSSGVSTSDRRWIMYYDSENPETGWSLLDSRRVHPYQRADNKRAKIRGLTLNGFDAIYHQYWVVTGMTFATRETEDSNVDSAFIARGDDILIDFNDFYSLFIPFEAEAQAISFIDLASKGPADDVGYGTTWNPDYRPSQNVVIQRNTLHDGITGGGADQIAILIRAANWTLDEIHGVKILDNDIWNNAQGLQFTCCGGDTSSEPGPAPGMLIQNNHVWIDAKWDTPCDWVEAEEMTTMGSGDCQCAEIAGHSMKSGGVIGNPVLIRRNLYYHGQPSPNRGVAFCQGNGAGGQGLGTGGSTIGTRYIRLERNIVWDHTELLGTASAGSHAEFLYNIVVGNNPGSPNPANPAASSDPPTVWQNLSNEVKMFGNLFVAAPEDMALSEIFGRTGDTGAEDWIDMQCNVFVASHMPPASFTRGDQLFSEWNYFYTDEAVGGDGTVPMRTDRIDDDVNSVVNEDRDAHGLGELCVKWKHWVDSEVTCIPNARTTSDSPHANFCSSPTRDTGRRGGGTSGDGLR